MNGVDCEEVPDEYVWKLTEHIYREEDELTESYVFKNSPTH